MSFTLSQIGQRSLLGVFWAIPPLFLGGTAAAAGIALINSLGNLGGAVGPTVVGSLRGSSGDYTSGLLVLAAALVIEAILVASMRLPRQTRPFERQSRRASLNMSATVITATTALPMTTDRLIQAIARKGRQARRHRRLRRHRDRRSTEGADGGEPNSVGDQADHHATVWPPQGRRAGQPLPREIATVT